MVSLLNHFLFQLPIILQKQANVNDCEHIGINVIDILLFWAYNKGIFIFINVVHIVDTLSTVC